MKINKLFLGFFMVIITTFILVGCGGKTNEVNKFTIRFETFGGTEIQSVTKEENEMLHKFKAPEKEGFDFVDFYLDEEYTNIVSWPLKITRNQTIYLKYEPKKSSLEKFLDFRKQINESNSVHYTYNLNVSTKFKDIKGPSSDSTGFIKYDKLNKKYYKYQENSGLLLKDSFYHEFLKENKLTAVKVNKNSNLVYHVNLEDVNEGFNQNSSTFSKILFEYKDEDIKNVKFLEENKYEITYKLSNSKIISTALKLISSPLVQIFLNVPDTDSSVKAYVYMNKKRIISFEYIFTACVSDGEIDFTYKLDMQNFGDNIQIEYPKFENLYTTQEELNNVANEINGFLTNHKNQTLSKHEYTVKTGVKFEGKNEINSTTKGYSIQKLENSKKYFYNEVEVDSDYKNADLYQNKINDYKVHRYIRKNNEVVDRTKKVLKDTFQVLEDYNNYEIDTYYMLLTNNIISKENILFIHKHNNKYFIRLNNQGIKKLLAFIDDSIRLDNKNDITIYNISSDFAVYDFSFEFELKENKLESLDIFAKGSYVSNQYPNTSFTGKCDFDFKYNLKVKEIKKFEITNK